MLLFSNWQYIPAFTSLLCLIVSASSTNSLPRLSLRNRNENNYGYEFNPEQNEIVAARSEPLDKSNYIENDRQKRMIQQQQDDCSLCQGLNLLADKEPDPVQTPNLTCADVDNMFRFNWTAPTEVPGTCLADGLYNFYSDICCKPSIPRYECEQNVHDLLFGDRAINNYNKAVPPVIDIDEPLDVSVSIIYQALERIDVELGTATVFLTITLQWIDPRLAWDVLDSDTCSNVIDVYAGHEDEKSMIWVPNFDLVNQIDGVQSFPEFKGIVFSDGTVKWTIQGGLNAFCAFSGLASIPFDTLGCQLFFHASSRTFSKLTRYTLQNPDIAIGTFDVTYNEWQLVPELMEQGLTFDETTIYYDVFFRRAKKFYITNIVWPTILLTYLSFCTYFLDVRVGERLGFGMALALVIVAQQIITVELSPVSNQALWLDKFVGWSFYWVLFGLVQSVMIGFLYYIREDRKTDKLKKMQIGEIEKEERQSLTENISMSMSMNLRRDSFAKLSLHPSLEKNSISLRTIDLLSFLLAAVTYSTFIAAMLITAHTGKWLVDEPTVFHGGSFPGFVYYDSNDPNS